MEEPAKTDLLTMEGLCTRLMISETIVYRLLRTGKIKAFKVDTLWRIPVSAVDAYIAETVRDNTQVVTSHRFNPILSP